MQGLFLSCLCGRERLLQPLENLAAFLSCLCGREQDGKVSAQQLLFSELPMRQRTQTPPNNGFDVLVGVAVSPTRLLLDFQDPIEME